MRRTLSVLLWILLGAFASGASVGFFLHQSNQDRLALLRQLEQTKQELANAKRVNEQIHDEAAQRIALAKSQAEETQLRLQKLDEAHALIEKAQALPKITQTKQWSEQVSVPLGLSFLTPPKSQSWMTDQILGVGSGNPQSAQGLDQWLSVSAYDQKREESIASQLENAKQVVFKAGDHILIGKRGILKNTDAVTYVMQSQQDGQPTHFLWARTNKDVNETRLLETLGSFSFGPMPTNSNTVSLR